jgi:ferredoxin
MCDGYGHCAELAPELVALDEWGYPIISVEAIGAHHDPRWRSAQLAVRGCPRQALFLERVTG